MTRYGFDSPAAGRSSVEERALSALRTAVECLMAGFAFEWGTRLWALYFSLHPGESYRPPVAWGVAGFAAFWFGLFGATFWKTTGRIEGGRPSRRRLILLVFQFFVAWGGSFELILLVGFQAPFVLSGRPLALFLALATLLPEGHLVFELALLDFRPPPEALSTGYDRLPLPVGVALSLLSFPAWMGFGAAAGWIAARAVRSWRELLRANAELRASRELLSENTRVAERLHISRELHDVLGHHLAALTQHLEVARRRAEGDAVAATARAQEAVRRLLERLRGAVATMRRPATLELGKALRTLVHAATDVRTEVRIPDDLRLAPVHTEALFRCACEAMGSAFVDGGRPKVTVELTRRPEGHVLTVRVDPAPPRPLNEDALRGLRERLRALGGVLEAGVSEDAFQMRVDLPDAETAP